jgi:hypothetical protein
MNGSSIILHRFKNHLRFFPKSTTFLSHVLVVSCSVVFKLAQVLQRGIPKDADARTAQLNTVFGTLFIIGLMMERFL